MTSFYNAASILYLGNPYVLPWNALSSLAQDDLPYYLKDRLRRMDADIIRAPFAYDANLQGYILDTNTPFPIWDWRSLGGTSVVTQSTRTFRGKVETESGPAVLQNRFNVDGKAYNLPSAVIPATAQPTNRFVVVRIKIPADFGYANDAVQYLVAGEGSATICSPKATDPATLIPEIVGSVAGILVGDNESSNAPVPYGPCLQCQPLTAATQYYYVEGDSLWYAQAVSLNPPFAANPVTVELAATVSEIPRAANQTAQRGGPAVLCATSSF